MQNEPAMNRCFWVGALLALSSAACRSPKSYSPPSNGDNGSSDASTGPCVCLLTSGGMQVAVACGGTGCADNMQYLCQGGNPIPIDVCGDAGAPLGGEDGGCTPVCTGRTCGGSDGCGGTCVCGDGLPCNTTTGACGNGCHQIAGDPCSPDGGSGSDPYMCCEDGYQCAPGDAGYPGCCATTSVGDAGLGTCAQDTDCCDYPSVHCGSNHLCQ